MTAMTAETSPKKPPQHRGTFVKCIEGLQHPSAEGGQGVLDAGAQAEHALQVGLPQQLLPVGHQVGRPAQQRRHVVHKLGHQAGVGVVGLAVVVGHHLGTGTGNGKSGRKSGEKFRVQRKLYLFVFIEDK